MPMLFHRFAPALMSIAALTALSSCGSPAPQQEPPLAGAAIGGPFELIDSEGKSVRWSDFEGKYRMVYFGYAYCPDVCPFDMQRMAGGLKLFAQNSPDLAADVQAIFITIDPERDTPEVVGEFTAAFSDDLLGLTGSAQQVKTAADAFAVYYEKLEEGSGGGYLMAHSNAAFLMGRNGEPIALLPVDLNAEAVATELEKWVS